MHRHTHADTRSCLYCKVVQFVSIGEPPPVKSWKRPLLLVAGIALTVCTVMALRFSWERAGATFFAAVSCLLARETGQDDAWAAGQVTAYAAAVRTERGVLGLS